ncbi:hypothetical protein CI109_106773 [Kwoniella shandongensis]|uniref:Uncharacterized protein n=1 Tax=Kwoniella shandongensis TaxID=1734106 RepID=A0A5M6C7C1_9TREE|nr:uncharacterized protein CI109_000971 [Kwoniella shandongensis]KAA5530791.1 hypothetical protein CI109_000971 [Kwoniella shandongensis]
MPGSKRRALKKLLSPNSSPQTPPPPSGGSTSSISSTLPPPPSSLRDGDGDGSISPAPALDIPVVQPATVNGSAGDSFGDGSGISVSKAVMEENAVLEQMHEREKEIGQSNANDVVSQSQSPSSSQQHQRVTADELIGASGGGAGGLYGNGFGANGGGKKKKSSRQKFEERQARKQEALINSAPPSDPNWTAQLEKERQEEIQIIGNACTVMGREIYEIAPDGHCMYSAIADQLGEIGILPSHEATNYQVTRNKASEFMLRHPDDFMPFLPSITGEDSAGATDDGMMTEKGFRKYCQLVAETGEWGGEPEIQALSRAFNIPIHVFQRGPPTVVSHGGGDDAFGGAMSPEQSAAAGDKVVRISYHKRMYGLGEHYNSLRKAQ